MENQALIHVPQTQHVSVFSSSMAFDNALKMAQFLSGSTLVPQEYRGERGVANCLIAIELADRIGASAFMVMQNLHIIHGRPSWGSSFLIGTINTCGKFTPLRFEWVGELRDGTRGCRAIAKDKVSGEVLEGTWITWKMVQLEGWNKKAGSKWMTMPEQMFKYRAAGFWSRVYAPEVSLGMLTQEEAVDIDIAPQHGKLVPATRTGIKVLDELQEETEPEPIKALNEAAKQEPVSAASVQEPTAEEAVDTETKELEEAFQKASELASKLSEPAKWRVAIDHAYGMKSTERLLSLAASMTLAIEQKAKVQAEAKAAPAPKQEPVQPQPQAAELPPKQELKLNRLGELIKTAVDEEVLTKEEAVAFWSKHNSGADQRPIMEDIEKLITPREAKMLHEAVAGKITDFAQKKDWLALCPKLHESGWYRALPVLLASGRMEKSGAGAGSKYKPVTKSVLVIPVKPEATQESPVKAAEKALEKALEDGTVTIDKADSIQEDIDFYASQMDEAALLGLAEKLTKGTI